MRQKEAVMDVEQAHQTVLDRLGVTWNLAHVTSRLVPGAKVGEPTRRLVEVALVRGDPDGIFETTYEGSGETLEAALEVALGNAERSPL